MNEEKSFQQRGREEFQKRATEADTFLIFEKEDGTELVILKKKKITGGRKFPRQTSFIVNEQPLP